MLTWLESRTGFVSMTKNFLTEDVPGGPSYWYVFGSATLFAMILQIVTGIFLTFYYAPSSASAWESTLFIYQKVPLGSFVISLHYWGATAMIALVAMHLVQVAVWGAYKRPRELQWVVGIILFVLTLVLGLTGYLLPWDLNAYFASQVALNITGAAPVAGPFLQNWLQGGPTMGTLTLNKFFGIHVWLTPLILILLVGVHLIIFRHNGSAGPARDERQTLKPGRFWPNQMFMDTVASFVVLGIIVLLSVVSPAPLDAKADPNNDQFVPAPAWYFMGLYYLLEIFPGQFGQLIGTIVIPTAGLLFLILLPWLDRNPSRDFKRRPIALVVTAIFVLIAGGLSIAGQGTVNEKAAARGQTAPAVPGGADAAKVAAAAAAPLPATGSAAGLAGTSSASSQGASVYSNNCSGCHGATGQGTPGVFPPLAGNPAVTAADPRAIIQIVLNGKTGPLKVGATTYNGTMPAWKSQLKPNEIADVLTYIRGTWGNQASEVSTAQVQAAAK
ncbi:MAG: cytochrome b N-terminal domain-containing protein [Vulcanimicrobiaceae bacterium]